MILFIDAIKGGKERGWDTVPHWLYTLYLSKVTGIPLSELLELPPIWVERIREYQRLCKKQNFYPF